jgi:hypothetical protein
VEAFNLASHPNFAVSGNAQSPLKEGGNGDAYLKMQREILLVMPA